MGNSFVINKTSFHWEYTEEPHKSRRVEILNKHPEIKKLMKPDGDRKLALFSLLIIFGHFGCAYLTLLIPYAPVRFLFIIGVGSWFSTLIMLHVHEAAHGLVFGPNHVWKNRLYGLLASLAMAIPTFSFFKKHHKNHHKALGDEILDAEYPSEIETKLFPCTPLGKYLWLLANPCIFAVRTPALIVKRFQWGWDFEEMANIMSVLALDLYLFYNGYTQMFNYLGFSSLVSFQTNMFGFWGVVSHVEFVKMKETSSYYGWMNKIYLNFGYHVEHHDFPSIPSKLLPQVKEMAPEFYEDNFVLDSFLSAAIKFIFDDKIGVNSRLKRENPEPWKYSFDKSPNFRKFEYKNKYG